MKEFIYSRNAVYETLRAGRRQVFRLQVAQGIKDTGRINEILRMANQRKIPVVSAARNALDRIHPQHQGVTLEASGYPYSNLADVTDLAEERGEPLFVLLLDALNDPQNFGSLIRTAEAVGVHGVIIPTARTVQVTPAVVNASSGAAEHMLIVQSNLSQAITQLKEAGAWIVGLEGGHPQSQPPGQLRLDGAIGLVVGSEGEGMRSLTQKSCDILMKLPMIGQIGSLNAAVAGSVALYLTYLARQQR
ncbi:MAG: 23S rRNA (guanosine(2251)-2'-O)-methyltransferase RlmB [Anaerolineales bacterium]|nr:23S rRNA (guanosine(2251)-2'-O)-methyltransferase RlmB [Anaerolineales bacterium]